MGVRQRVVYPGGYHRPHDSGRIHPKNGNSGQGEGHPIFNPFLFLSFWMASCPFRYKSLGETSSILVSYLFTPRH